jgi:hypothetical protein
MDMVDSGSLHDQLQSATPKAEHVPMAEQEARASRFVSHLVGDTGTVRPQPNSSKEHPLLLLQVRQQWLVDQALDKKLRQLLP